MDKNIDFKNECVVTEYESVDDYLDKNRENSIFNLHASGLSFYINNKNKEIFTKVESRQDDNQKHYLAYKFSDKIIPENFNMTKVVIIGTSINVMLEKAELSGDKKSGSMNITKRSINLNDILCIKQGVISYV